MKHARLMIFWMLLIVCPTLGADAPTTARSHVIVGARVVAFGDSITHDNGKLKWTHWTKTIKDRFGLELINAGVGGNTTLGGVARLDQDVLSQKPDFVLISFGMNDHVMKGKGQPNVPLDEFEKNLTTMVEKIRAIGAVPAFVTTTIYEGNPADPNERSYSHRHDPAFYAEVGGAQAWLDRYIDLMRKVGKEMNVGVADVRKACDAYPPNKITIEGVHPGELGNQVYAKTVGDFLASH